MKKRLFPVLLAALLLLGGCTPAPAGDEKLHILATTYPIYLLVTDLTTQTEDVTVDLLVIVMNGAGLEDFMSDALSQSSAAVIDCSRFVDLLPTLEHAGHDGHDHEEEWDPHYWMDAGWGLTVRNELRQALAEYVELTGPFVEYQLPDPASLLGGLSCPYLITFHDGFQYFAKECGLTLLKAIEEEEGSTASAREIKEITALIDQYHIPAIFVEKNGSRATAEVISRETGCGIYELDMLMSGGEGRFSAYLNALYANMETVREALK